MHKYHQGWFFAIMYMDQEHKQYYCFKLLYKEHMGYNLNGLMNITL